MDDETAEIELLEQNLNKTRQISKRMTSILDSFDTRLAKLEKSILPLYTSTQILNRRASNIDKTLVKIDEVASNQEGVAVEEALILRGPQTGQLETYREALERLNATIAFKSSELDMEDTARLIETGAKKLTQLYTKLVAENSSGSTPAPGSDYAMPPFPTPVLTTLRQLVSIVRTMPLPTTHPSHPAAPEILITLKDAQKGYADMRGVWAKKCLEMQGKRVVDRADTIDGVAAGKEFGRWVELVLSVADDEYQLLLQLTPLAPPMLLASTYATLLAPLLTLFGSTLGLLTALIKKALHKYTFLALAAYDVLLELHLQWDAVLARRGPEARGNELKDALGTLRAVCLRSFPEFLADLKMGAMGRGGETTGLADFAINTVKYMERLPQVEGAAASALMTLGDGNWKMGEGVQVGKTPKSGDNDERVILEHFVYDVVTTAVNSLTTLSRTSRRPALGSIFLLNNISYLRHHLLSPSHSSAASALPTLLSKPTKDILHSSFRTAKAAYFDSNFSPLMQALVDDPKEKNRAAAAKERFTRFYDLLEEVVERHRLAKVMEDDLEGRETIGEEVVRLVVPALQRFTQKQKDKEFSKNPQKYIKMSPEAVETQLKSIFR